MQKAFQAIHAHEHSKCNSSKNKIGNPNLNKLKLKRIELNITKINLAELVLFKATVMDWTKNTY